MITMPEGRRAQAFSIVEIVLALAIIATAFVALLGLLPAGLDASRKAADSTVVALVLEEVHSRLQNQPLRPGVVMLNSEGPDSLGRSPLFFDDHGVFIAPDAPPEELARRLYRADVRLANWISPPPNTSGLRAAIVSLSWPVSAATGESIGQGNPKATVTYNVTALTGPDWTRIYPAQNPAWQYQEKIGF